MTRVAVYSRISADAEGKAAGVQRQERDCRQLAKAKGWTVADVLIDNDRSAYNGAARPAYDQLLAGLADGTYDGVVAWKLDRLSRRGVRGLVPLLDALDGRPLVCVHDAIDTSTAMGEGWAGMLASMARQESDNIGTRVRRKKEELAERGAPAGGKRAFCFEPDGVTIRESEAKVYRRAMVERAAGKSYSQIVREWNDAGVKPPQAEQWNTTTVRYVLTSERHAGRRTHRGEVYGKAAWPSVVPADLHDAVVALDEGGTQPRRRSLLTHLVVCHCDAAMARDGRSFRCRRDARRPEACGHNTIKADTLEDLVEEMVLELLYSPKLAAVMAASGDDHDDGAAMDVAAAEAKMVELDEMLGDGVLSRASYLRARKAPERKLEDARRRLAQTNGTRALERFRGRKRPREMYAGLDVDERRAVIGALLDRVVIRPAKNRSPKFDVGRVDPRWKF